MTVQEDLQKAVGLRNQGKPQAAFLIIKKLLEDFPNDAKCNYQAAWTCDYMGKESEALPYYERAIKNGLVGDDLKGALLGLGSTYRCLGKYQESLSIFDKAVAEFPEDRAFKVFRAMTLYNLKRHDKAFSEMLIQLLDTTSDKDILAYEKALRFYSDKLDETW
ncbi:MAG: tetratricopeptide repeat protein [Bdellovibrionales bacterium]|nr:tetratricopeptide repeat protein [Bdellovibrionales bacterium]